MYRPLLLAALLTLPGTRAVAQAPSQAPAGTDITADTINTDRPDLPQSSITVEPGRFQLESGLQWMRQSGAGALARAFSVPVTLRYGVAPDWEARLDTNGYTRQVLTGAGLRSTASGGADVLVGFKHHLRTFGARSTGVLFEIELPTGTAAYRSNSRNPTLTLAEDVAYGSAALSLNAGAAYLDTDQGQTTVAQWAGSWTQPVSRGAQGFVDLGGAHPLEHGGPQVLAGFGVFVPMGLRQVDAAAHFGLTHEAPTWTLTTGYGQKW